jgi:hypothetical protein
MFNPHSTQPDQFPQRQPQRAIRVIALARQQSPLKTPEAITDEALRLLDRRHTRSRSWWRRMRDRYEASPLLQAITVGLAIYGCGAAIVVALWLVPEAWWAWIDGVGR